MKSEVVRGCPAEEDLLDLAEGTVTEAGHREVLQRHLVGCARCRVLFADHGGTLPAAPGAGHRPDPSPSPLPGSPVEAGQIWSTRNRIVLGDGRSGPETYLPRLVCILEQPRANAEPWALVAPLGQDPEWAGELDRLIGGEASPLGYTFFLQLWNRRVIPLRGLQRLLGRLDPETLTSCLRLAELAGRGEPLPPELAVTMGLRPADDEELQQFRQEERDALEYLARPGAWITGQDSPAHDLLPQLLMPLLAVLKVRRRRIGRLEQTPRPLELLAAFWEARRRDEAVAVRTAGGRELWLLQHEDRICAITEPGLELRLGGVLPERIELGEGLGCFLLGPTERLQPGPVLLELSVAGHTEQVQMLLESEESRR